MTTENKIRVYPFNLPITYVGGYRKNNNARRIIYIHARCLFEILFSALIYGVTKINIGK